MEFLNSIGSWLSIWDTTRALALTSYLLLFVSMVAGILQSMKIMPPKSRANLATTHNLTGWFGLLFGLTHGLVLLYDTYVGYSLAEILIPFTAKKDAFEIGLGVITMYIMFLLVLSSDLLKRLGKKVWRSVHYLSFPAFIMALYHGIAIGTDTAIPGIQMMYIVTGLTVAALVVMRIIYSLKSKKKQLLA
jgi:sulfoxide reductase heme-binding subunit YedZ